MGQRGVEIDFFNEKCDKTIINALLCLCDEFQGILKLRF